MTKNKFGILYVDDEENSLKYFEEAFGDMAPIYTANNPEEGLKIFRANIGKIGVVLSDKRMPVMSGIEFLTQIKQIDDKPLRLLVTAFADMSAAVDHLNDGLIYTYLTKPWDPRDLKSKLGRALDRFWITNETNKLLKQRGAAFQEMMMAEKAATIATISNGLNHHMFNALNVIQAYFDMIPVQLGDDMGSIAKDSFFWGEYYKTVEEQLSKVIAILSNLTAWETNQSGQPNELEIEENVDVVAIFNKAAETELSGHSNFEFLLTEMDKIGTISGDPEKLTTMACHLIREAKQNIEESGKIEIQLFTTSFENLEAIRVRVIDNGKPIPESERLHLFDPFFVRSDKPSEVGTGMLYSYLTVFHHGGNISASSLKDGRNMIEFRLPRTPNRQPERKLPFN